MSRRNALLGACLYFLALNQVPLAVLELALPAFEDADSSDSGCSSHACGCASRDDCLADCCCLKKPGDRRARVPEAPATRTARVLASLVAGCSGGAHETAQGAKRTAPHLVLSPLPAPRPARRDEWAALREEIPPSASEEPPGKVPIYVPI